MPFTADFRAVNPFSSAPLSLPETDDEALLKAKGDRMVFPTESGMDIYLYHTDQGFQLY